MHAAPGSIVSAAVALIYHHNRGNTHPVDYQRFLLSVTGDSLIGDYKPETLIAWAKAIISAVETAAANPPAEPNEHVVTVEYRINPTEYLSEFPVETQFDHAAGQSTHEWPTCPDTDEAALNLVHRGVRYKDVDLPVPTTIRCGTLVLDPQKGYVR